MSYMLYDLHEICKLVTNLMSKFIRKKVLPQNSQGNVSIDVLKVENHKSKKNVEIGVKARKRILDKQITFKITRLYYEGSNSGKLKFGMKFCV